MSKITNLFIKLKLALKHSWQNYPEALSCAYAFAVLAIIEIHFNHEFFLYTNVQYGYVMITLLTAVPILMSTAALAARFKLALKWRLLGTALVAGLMTLLCLSLPDPLTDVDSFRLLVLNISFYILFTLIPFKRRDHCYDLGVMQLLNRAAMTLLYSLVLQFGLFAILLTVDKLLGITVDGEIYSDIGIMVFALFAPTFFLGEIPNRQTVQEVVVDRLIKKLHVYVIMPLILVYTAILYLYFIKIVFAWSIPRNLIVHLTLWYGLIAVLTMFFSNSYRAEFALSALYHKWMPRLLVLPLAMMAFSLYLRIAQYGVTVKRYFVAALALWLIGVVIYFVFSRTKIYQYIAIAAIVVMVISLYAPINAFNVSFHSQYNRLVAVLTRNAMLADGKLIGNAAISDDDKYQIDELVRYFYYQEQLDRIPFLEQDFDPFEDMEATFGFEYYGDYRSASKQTRISYYSSTEASTLDIAPYRHFQLIELKSYESSDEDSPFYIDAADNLVVRRKDGAEAIVIPLGETFDGLRGAESTPDQPLLVVGNAAAGFQIAIRELSGYYDAESDSYDVDYLLGYLFTN